MTARKGFKPGHRSNPQLMGTGKMSENRYAWIRLTIGQFVIMLEPDEAEVGTSVRLIQPRPGARSVISNITALTVEELDAMEQFFKLLFDTARPVVVARDKAAQDALDQGDDSHARSYRQPPQFVVRERALREHNEGVPVGPDGVPPVAQGADPDGAVRGTGDGMAEQPSSDRGPQDDGPQGQ